MITNDEEVIREHLRAFAKKRPRWGWRRAATDLRSHGYKINNKRVRRLWRDEGLRVPQKRKKKRLTGVGAHVGLMCPIRPNALWAMDFQFDTMIDGRQVKLLNIIDEYTRECLAIVVAHSINAEQVVGTLARLAIERGDTPAFVRFDNGPEFVSNSVADWCQEEDVDAVFIDPGSPWQNAWIESFNSRLRDELLNMWQFDSLLEARVLIEDHRIESRYVGKLHNDRYIPLHPDLKTLLDDWIANHRPAGLRSDRLLLENGRPITKLRISNALARIADEAGIGHVTPHQLRHTLATQAINRGMSLEAIAALLGHKTLAMTMVYARIADKTVADEYFAVTEKVEALYGQPRQLSADDEGTEMRKLRAEMHRRMLGNGYCARPVEMDCHFESICESCNFFVTTIEFKPTLRRQRDDAADKGQIGRQKIFDGLLNRLDEEAS